MATTTLTVPNADVPDYLAMIGKLMGLTVQGTNTPRSATAAEANAWLVQHLQGLLHQYRKAVALAAVAEPTDSAITAA